MGKVELLAVEGTAGNPLCSLWQGWHQGAGLQSNSKKSLV